MTNSKSFRYGKLPKGLSPKNDPDKSIISGLASNFQNTFFKENDDSTPPTKASNYAVAISRKMWMDMTNIFFNESDFEQHDGVLVNFGFDDVSRNLVLLFQGFSTLKEPDGDDFGINSDDNSYLRIMDESLTDAFKTGGGSGATEDGGVTTSQIPPKS